MYSFRTASKAACWLLAALVPLQGLPVGVCRCAAEAKAAVGEGGATRHAGCCCCSRGAGPAERPATHSCCGESDSDVSQTCHCSETGCHCRHGDESRQPEPIPPERRTQSSDLAIGPAPDFCIAGGDPETMDVEGQKAHSLCGSDLCVVLCRFHL